MRQIFNTSNDPSLLIARLILGILFFAHGGQKVFGWWGGLGFSGTMHFMTAVMHIPAVFALLAICAEFLGGLGLIIGLLTRVAAFGVFVVMVVAIFLVSHKFGLFMNWGGQQKGEGFEYHLLAIALAIVLMAKGAGALSIDRGLGVRKRTR